jgi:hypothetical protein
VVLGTKKLDAGGAATLTTSSLAAGNHLVTATYDGDDVFAARTSGTLTQVVTGPSVADLFGPHPNADLNTAFVKGLYHGVLGRDGESAGIDFWLLVLSRGVTRKQVTLAFVNSIEHRRQQVDGYYRSFLGRPATEVASSFWVNLLLADGDEGEVIRGILTSKEYTANHAGNSEFVDQLYFLLLGRAAKSDERAQWEGRLSAGESRADVVDGFLRSREAATLLVTKYYAALLYRTGDPAQEFWISQRSQGTLTESGVELGFLNSSEFFQNAQKSVP